MPDLNAERADLRPQTSSCDSEDFRGLQLVSPGVFEQAHQDFALHAFEGFGLEFDAPRRDVVRDELIPIERAADRRGGNDRRAGRRRRSSYQGCREEVHEQHGAGHP